MAKKITGYVCLDLELESGYKLSMTAQRAEQYIDSLLAEKEESPPRANVGAFLNTLTQNLQKIQLSGIAAVSERRETESQIVLTITIPK